MTNSTDLDAAKALLVESDAEDCERFASRFGPALIAEIIRLREERHTVSNEQYRALSLTIDETLDRAEAAEARAQAAETGLREIANGYGVQHMSKWARAKARAVLSEVEGGEKEGAGSSRSQPSADAQERSHGAQSVDGEGA